VRECVCVCARRVCVCLCVWECERERDSLGLTFTTGEAWRVSRRVRRLSAASSFVEVVTAKETVRSEGPRQR